jgi:hypothetical protein
LKLKSLAAALLAAAAMPASAVSFINGIAIPGSTGDQFGSSVNDGRLGMFSDLYYDPNRNEWWGLSDRGPGGGTLPYDGRVQRFTLDVARRSGASASPVSAPLRVLVPLTCAKAAVAVIFAATRPRDSSTASASPTALVGHTAMPAT